MDFSLPKDVLDCKRVVEEFVSTKVNPLTQEIEETEAILKVSSESRRLGFFGFSIPKKYGVGIGMGGKCVIYEELQDLQRLRRHHQQLHCNRQRGYRGAGE